MKIFAFFLLILLYSCSDKNFSDKKITNNFYDTAWTHFEKGENIAAFIQFGKAKDFFLKKHDSLSAGKCLMNMAIIQEQMGDNFGSQETALAALIFFNEENKNHQDYLSANYNNLGIVNNKLHDYDKAISFYEKAIIFSQDSLSKNIYRNNIANIYRKKANYNKANEIFEDLKKVSGLTPKLKSKVIDNSAFNLWLQNSKYNPIRQFHEALAIRLKDEDHWGQNSSYAHLADYYSKNNQDSAAFFARKMYYTATEINSPDDKIEALQKLISLENPENSKQYFKEYQKLNDSLQTARNKAKNQFALIRYETEKNKASFLRAQAESTERQNHIIKQYFWLAILTIALILSYFLFRRTQKIHQQEKLLEVKNTELKYSKKVHDRVANKIYQILSQVENKDYIDRDSLLFALENVYETSRDISYENEDINENVNYSEQLHLMLDSYSSDSVQIIFFGNNEKLWEGVSFQIKTEVYLILQELMTNMKKHSLADKVFLKFTNENSNINISYTDNGVGIKDNAPKNGLQNMENRIISINGKINFDTETNLLKINIIFPI